ncbi:MAG: hypothetical protein WC889_13525 [Myxococcota bacterium]|jgi:plasmid stability protein
MADKVFVRDIPDELWSSLKVSAAGRKMTISKAVAEAIKMWIAKGEKTPGFRYAAVSNLGSSGVEDVSENHDRYLAGALK